MDEIDRRILETLRLNSRITYAELSAQVALSPSACMRRVDLMEKAGIIKGYTILIDGDALGERITVFTQVTLERQTDTFLSRFEAAVKKFPEIRECFMMTGAPDYILRIEVESAQALERLHKEVLSSLPGVKRINSSFAIKTIT